MNNNILNDDTLDSLGYIKHCDIFSIVDKEFDKKREKKRVRKIIGIATLIIAFISLTIYSAIIMPKIVVISSKLFNLPKLLIGYYFISISMMMLLIIPISKRKKTY